MKKRLLLLSVIPLLSLVSCIDFSSLTIDGEWEYKGEDQESAVSIYTSFIEETKNSKNMKVTIVQDGAEEVYVCDGDSCLYHSDMGDIYTFIQNGEYYYVNVNEHSSFYQKGKENYEMNHRNFEVYFDLYVSFGESATYLCTEKGESQTTAEGETSSASLQFTITAENESASITAEMRNGLLTSFASTYTYTDEEGTQTMQSAISFVYGEEAGSVAIPDISQMEELGAEADE